jgi:hypothetical protein
MKLFQNYKSSIYLIISQIYEQSMIGQSISPRKNHYYTVFNAPITIEVKMVMPLSTKTNASVLVVAALTVLMATLLFREVPTILVAAARPGLQPNPHSPTPPPPHVQSSAEAARAGICPRTSLCDDNVPTPPGCCTRSVIKSDETLPRNLIPL